MWTFLPALLLAAPPGPAQPAKAAKQADDLRPGIKIESAGKPIDVDIGHSAPWVADLAGDGKLSLLVGQFGDGKVRIYPNTGTRKAPGFEKFDWLQAGGEVCKIPTG
jgi:hypothetical protein